MVVAYALTYLAQVLGQYLAGIGDSRANFRVQLAGAAASVAVGLPLAAQFGVMGASAGAVAVNAVRLAAGAACARRRREAKCGMAEEGALPVSI
ncbi:MAG: polysaccharide biosynthesis C-terminal domain-containing protein [Bryobacteraceae bacterium]